MDHGRPGQPEPQWRTHWILRNADRRTDQRGADADAGLQPIGIYSPSIASSLQNPALNSLGRFDASGYDPVNNVSGDGFDLPRQLPYLGPIQEIQPGDSWSFQFWYRDRDANGAPASNLSTMAVISFL